MQSLINLPDIAYKAALVHGFTDDLDHFVTGDRFTSIEADTDATVAAADGAGGRVKLTTGDTDNNEAYLHTTHETFKVANGKPLIAGAIIQHAEANVDDANILFGFMDNSAANHLLDNGGGPAASYSGALFFKADGGTRWQVESSIGVSQTTSDTEETSSSASFQHLQIQIAPVSAAEAEVTFWLDPLGGTDLRQVREFGANPRTPAIKHRIAYGTATEMDVILGAKAGGDNSEVVTADLIYAYQKR